MEFNENDLRSSINNFKKIFKTEPKLKWIIVILMGFLPMFICWFLFGGNDSNLSKEFLWMSKNPPIFLISYGFQWLAAIIVYISSSFVCLTISKLNQKIKSDVLSWVMFFNTLILNFWILNVGFFMLLTIPITLFFSFVASMILRIMLFLKAQKINFLNLKNNFTEEEKEKMEKLLKDGNIEEYKKEMERILKEGKK